MTDTSRLVVLAAMLSVALTCSEQNIDACFLPLDTFLDGIHANRTVSENGFALSHLQDSELDQFCSIWENSLSGCLKSIRPQCGLPQRMEFEGIEDGYDFVCRTLDRYKPFKPCINSNVVARGLASCEHQFVNDITDALYEDEDHHFNQGVCNAVHQLITCDYKVVQPHCGVDAAQWVEEFETLFNSKYMDEVHGCSDQGSCTLQNEEKCWKSVDVYLESISQSPIGYGEFEYRNLTVQQLSQFCSLYDSTATQCLADLKPSCSDFERQRFEGDELSLDFLCQSGFSEFVKHRDCLATDEVSDAEKTCIRQFNDDMDHVYEKSTTEEMHTAYCKAIQDLIGCKQDVASSHCGDEAGEWMQEFDRLWLEPYLDGVTCENVVGSHCSDDKVDACWAPGDTYLSDINKQRTDLGLALRELNDDQVRKYCKTYEDDVLGCLNKVKPYCTRQARSILHTQMYTLDFLCGTQIETNLERRTCLISYFVYTELLQCDATFTNTEQDTQASQTTHDAHKIYCDALDDYSHCDEDTIHSHCTGLSADWAIDYLAYLRLPLMKNYCSTQGLSGGAKAMIAIFTLLAVALIVVLAIVAFYIYKKKKAISDQNAHVRFENPLANGDTPSQPSAYIQNNLATECETKTMPSPGEDYSNAALEAYKVEHQASRPAENPYSEPYSVPTPQPTTDNQGYTSTEDVKPSIPETDITTTAASNPMYDNTSVY